MNFIATKLEGCFIIESKIILDERGYFMESFNENTFQKGINQKVHFGFNYKTSFEFGGNKIHFQFQWQFQKSISKRIR